MIIQEINVSNIMLIENNMKYKYLLPIFIIKKNKGISYTFYFPLQFPYVT